MEAATTPQIPVAVSVRVALRVRPAAIAVTTQPSTPNRTTTENRGADQRPVPRNCIQLVPDEPQIIIGREETSQKTFTYDHVFGPTSTQLQIYNELASPLVAQFLDGFNATILAYGQTFSGKTYTMGSSFDSSTPTDEMGIIPRVFQDIFNNLKEEEGIENILKVSFLEIYQEQIRDLLMPQSNNREISIRENNKGSIVISGIHEDIVLNAEDMATCLIAGGIERSTGDTMMHLHSSRSHAIFTITLEQADTTRYSQDASPVIIRRSKLHLVDLAGSERLKRTGAEGIRLKESVKINSGLLALGNVISILGDDKTSSDDRQTHVPYRDSKLTRLLQDSLGGNSQTLMLACVSPLYEDVDETINTMKYAYRARKIKNKPIVNVIDQLAMERSNMLQKITQLEGKLKGLEEHGTGPVPFLPDMIDFDNDQWMQYFMEQLKNRTVRGTNAVKALDLAKKENEELKKTIALMANETPPDLSKQVYDQSLDLREKNAKMESLQEMLDTLMQFCLKVFKGENVNEHEGAVKDILKSHFPMETMERSSSKDSLVLGGATPAPISNTVARIHRRKRITSEDYTPRETDHLELELRETRKCLNQMEVELNSTKIRLQQTEALSEQSSLEISKLIEQNEALKLSNGNQYTPEKLLKSSNSKESLFSQTASKALEIVVEKEAEIDVNYPTEANDSTDFPVIVVDNASGSALNVEKLAEELSIATKVKVDLLKELSKANKEAERVRHAHADQVLKLERELESTQREIVRVFEEHQEKDLSKDRVREDYERRIKQMESSISKYKNRQKELEKTLKDKGSGDRRLQESQQESEKLSIQIAGLKKKIKDDHDKFLELEARKSKELSTVNKQLEEETKKGRQLEIKFEMIRKKLDRKSEEVAAMGRKFKEPPPPSFRRQSLGSSVVDLDIDESISSIEKHVDPKYLEAELKLARRKIAQLEEEMERDPERAEKLQQEKSETILHIAELRTELKRNEAHKPGAVQEEVDLSPEFASVIEHFSYHQVLGAVSAIKDFNVSRSKAYILTCLKEVISLEKEIAELKTQSISLNGETLEYKEQVRVLDKRMQKVIRAYEKKVSAMKLELGNAVTSAEAAAIAAKDKEILIPSRPSTTQEVQTESIEAPPPPPPSTTPLELEKDVYYYRNVNKELKSKLREVVAVNHRLAKSLKEQASTSPSAGGGGASSLLMEAEHHHNPTDSFPVAAG